MSQTDPAFSNLRAQAAQLINTHDERPAWVWNGDGASLIWANEAGLDALELDDLDGQDVLPSAPATRSLQAVARTQVGLSGRGRIEILRVNAGGHQETLVATCRPVMLGETVAVLAMGNPSRPRQTPVAEPLNTDTQADDLSDDGQEDTPTFTLDITSPSFDAPDVPAQDAASHAETEEPAPESSGEDSNTPIDDATAPFAFKPRSRPHRFSFIVGPSGRIQNLSSGLEDAVGPQTTLRDEDVASEALLARLGDLPAAIFHGVDERRRFSEHEVMWPVSDHDLIVPVRLSAFDEDDGALRVFGTVLTGKAIERSATDAQTKTPVEAAPLAGTPDAEPLSQSAAESTGLAAAPLAAETHFPSQESLTTPAIAALDVEPLDEHAATAAGLFSSEPPADSNAAPMDMAAQVPGGATLVAAASAVAAGIAQGLSRPLDTPASTPQPPVQALDDALQQEEAATAGLWSATSVEAGTAPVAAIDDTLEPAEAEAAGLWASQPVEPPTGLQQDADVFAPSEPDGEDPEDFPAETVSAMKAVAAGVAAGLAGGVAGGVVSARQDPDDDETDIDSSPEIETDETSSGTEEDASESPSPSGPTPADDDLSRPESLTFQEIARRLGARITGRDGDDGGPRALHEGDDTSASHTPGDVVHLARGEEETVILDDDPTPTNLSPQETSARVLPFTRSEPNAERMVLDRLPLGIIIYSDDAILYANRAALDLAGLNNLQALKAMGGIETLFAEGMTDDGNGAMTLVQPDGTPVHVTGRLQSVRWDGEAAALMSLREHTLADSDAQEASQDASLLAAGAIQGANASDGALPLVRARIGELEAIIDLASDGVVTLDGEGEIKDLNQAAQALVGYAADDLIGQPFRLLFPEDSRQTALDYLEDMASQGHLSLFNEGRELECITSQGGLVPVFMTLGRLTDDEPAVYCAVLRDLSPFKQAETDLVEARKAAEEASAHKSDFLARVSHEIRTPLNAVIGFSEVMLEERFGPVGSERYRQYLRDIHTSGEHLMSLLNDLLDLSKIEAGKMELSFGEVDLNDVVQQCLAIMQPQANQGRIIVRTSLPLSLPKVVADLRSVRQVVLNLMSNAIKFTDPGGQIIVSTLYEPSGEVSLRVRDTGRGMDAADVELALEPFRQVPTTLNQVITGTGLGLPLTKALVEANRAQFGLESTPGEGTLAIMTFPSQRVLAE